MVISPCIGVLSNQRWSLPSYTTWYMLHLWIHVNFNSPSFLFGLADTYVNYTVSTCLSATFTFLAGLFSFCREFVSLDILSHCFHFQSVSKAHLCQRYGSVWSFVSNNRFPFQQLWTLALFLTPSSFFQ